MSVAKGDTIESDLLPQAASLVAASAALTTTDTVLLSLAIPANTLLAGTTYRLRVLGGLAGAGTPTFRVRFGPAGTTTDALVASVAPAGTGAGGAGCEFYVTFRTLGAAGTAIANGFGYANTLASTPTNQATATTVSTTVAGFLSLTASVSASTFTAYQASIELLRL